MIIGVDPHKRSVTLEVIDQRERVLHLQRFATDTTGYRVCQGPGSMEGGTYQGLHQTRALTGSWRRDFGSWVGPVLERLQGLGQGLGLG